MIQKIILVLFIGMISCKGKNTPAAEQEHSPEREISSIQLTDLNGNPINLEQYQGKTIFINFWATWCRPCLAEMPSIQRMMNELEGEDIVYLFASNETTGQIVGFKDRYSFPFHYVRVENFEELNIMALPTTYIFNASGKIVFSEQGFRRWDSAENLELIMKIVKSA